MTMPQSSNNICWPNLSVPITIKTRIEDKLDDSVVKWIWCIQRMHHYIIYAPNSLVIAISINSAQEQMNPTLPLPHNHWRPQFGPLSIWKKQFKTKGCKLDQIIITVSVAISNINALIPIFYDKLNHRNVNKTVDYSRI